jgi:hypothetical protein
LDEGLLLLLVDDVVEVDFGIGGKSVDFVDFEVMVGERDDDVGIEVVVDG